LPERVLNSFWLRPGRMTRFLPRFKGIENLQRFYRRFLDPAVLYRINNFDGTLKFDVTMTEKTGVMLWHTPQLYEARERKLFCAAITPGCAVLDVGANIGIYTLLAAKRGARVFAIEADPRNVAALKHHVALNGFTSQVSIIEMAAMEGERAMNIWRDPEYTGRSRVTDEGNTRTVCGRTIDSLSLPAIDVCKMDIEGSELRALRGMSDTLRRSPAMKLLIEYNSCSDQRALLRILRNSFKNISIAGSARPEPLECNLWCCN